MSQNITVSWRRSASRPAPADEPGCRLPPDVGGRAPASGQPGDRPHQPLAVAEADPELGKVGLGEVGEHVEIDAVLGEQLGVSAEADVLEPFFHLGHRSLRTAPLVRCRLA